MPLDEYERHARFVPGAAAVLPVAVVVVALGLEENPVIALLVAVASAIGAPIILADYVRHRGQMLQDRLFVKWGGSPTVARLRHRGPDEQASQRSRYRDRATAATGLTFPDEAEETSDPQAADVAYSDAVADLIKLTRDKQKFPLVFAENKNYGYARNLLGMRGLGVGVSIASCVALLGSCGLSIWGVWSVPLINEIVGAVVTGAMVVAWLVVPTEDRVRRMAEAYADRLFETI